MKTTPLYETHKINGAKFTNFNGWDMPLWFSSLENEHLHVRKDSGIFDVSHMGEIEIEGKDSLAFLEKTFTNKVSGLKNGYAKYGFFCNNDGYVIDDVIVYNLDGYRFFLCVNAGNIDNVEKWLLHNTNDFDVKVKNLSNFYGQVAIQGPNSIKYLSTLYPNSNLNDMPKYTIKILEDLDNTLTANLKSPCPNGNNFLIARTGYTGEDGFELFVPNEILSTVYEHILTNCANIIPCGLGSRDTLRIEMGFPLHGNELIEGTTPSDYNLDRFIDIDREEFIGKDAIINKIEKNEYSFIGFKMIDNSIARSGYEIYQDEKLIGNVTSGTFSPLLKKGIGMALVDSNFSSNKNLQIKIRKNFKDAKMVNYPFI